MAERFDKFTERAKKVLDLAGKETDRLGDWTVKPPHFLLGIIDEGNGLAMKVLSNLGLDTLKLRSEVETLLSSQRSITINPSEVGLSERSKSIFTGCVKEARALNHHYIGTEHLFNALVREAQESNDQPLLQAIRNSLNPPLSEEVDLYTVIIDEVKKILGPTPPAPEILRPDPLIFALRSWFTDPEVSGPNKAEFRNLIEEIVSGDKTADLWVTIGAALDRAKQEPPTN